MKTSPIPTILLCVFAAAACSREPDPAVQVPQDVREAVREVPQAMPAAVSKTVDVCALLAEPDASAVLGKLSQPPQAQTPQGSLLGGCDYFGGKGSGSVSAHPANEFSGTIKHAGKKKPVQALAGLGEAAYATEYGVMVQPAGRSYFLSVFIVGDNGPALTEALARKLKL